MEVTFFWLERDKKKQIITVISGGDKCYFRNKQDYVVRLERGATLNRIVREGFSEEMTFEWDLKMDKELAIWRGKGRVFQWERTESCKGSEVKMNLVC